MILLELLVAMLLTGLAAWPAVKALVSLSPERLRRNRGALVALGVFNSLTFVATFLLLDAGVTSLRLTKHPTKRAARPVVKITPESIAPLAPIASVEAAARIRDETRAGFAAGYRLATDAQHRGGKLPADWALDAMINIRVKGHSPDYLAGFRNGYVTGLKSTQESDKK